MAIVLMLLMAALVPTGNYNWSPYETFPTPTPSDYAICYLKWQDDGDEVTFASTVVSILILGMGFTIRIVKVIKTLSVDIFQQIRRRISNRLKTWLLFVYTRLDLNNPTMTLSIQRTLVYWPLLAIFLAIRVALDAWLSMLVEVSSAYVIDY
jgi:hypothetical protein